MKTIKNFFKTLAIILAITSIFTFSSCTKDDTLAKQTVVEATYDTTLYLSSGYFYDNYYSLELKIHKMNAGSIADYDCMLTLKSASETITLNYYSTYDASVLLMYYNLTQVINNDPIQPIYISSPSGKALNTNWFYEYFDEFIIFDQIEPGNNDIHYVAIPTYEIIDACNALEKIL